jgi:hypothetical protein
VISFCIPSHWLIDWLFINCLVIRRCDLHNKKFCCIDESKWISKVHKMNKQLHILSNGVILYYIGPRVTESASCTTGTGYFRGVKRLERGADHLPFSSAGLRMGRSCTTASPLCQHRYVIGWHIPLYFTGYFWSIQILEVYMGTMCNVDGVTGVASRIFCKTTLNS